MAKRPASAAARTADRIDSVERPHGVARTHAPPLAPLEQVIDLDHLAHMTLGERGLEHDVLALFEQQAGMLLARMAGEAPSAIAAHAHILIGSARGIGAWKVAAAAEAVERLAGTAGPSSLSAAISELAVAVTQARAAIAELLRPR